MRACAILLSPSILLGALLTCGCPASGTTDETGTTQMDTTAAPTGGPTSDGSTTSGGIASSGEGTSSGEDTTSVTRPTSTTDATSGADTTGAPFECEPPVGETDGASGTTDAGETDTTTGEPPAPIADWETYVAAECAALVDCGCVAPKGLGADLDACVATRGAELAALAGQGYAWDGACAALRLAGVAQTCAGDEMPCAAKACELFHGEVDYAQACESFDGATPWPDASTCTADLSCTGGLCVPACSGLTVCDGELCAADEGCFYDDGDVGSCILDNGEGEHCGHIYGPGCAAGLICTGDDLWDGTCVRVGAACEACAGACEPGLFCDGSTHLCWPRFPAGAPCGEGEHCESLQCGPDARCAPVPGEGEACPGKVCAAGLACGWPNFCWKIAGRGEPCPGIYHCEPGLVCGDVGVCEPPVCHAL